MKISFCSSAKYPKSNIANEAMVREVFKDFINPNKPVHNHDVYVKGFDSLKQALDFLAELSFSQKDIDTVKRYGVAPVFKSGAEALLLAQKNNIKIVYDKVSNPDVHAQWVNSDNKVIINDRYKNTKNLAEIYAISAAIFHELSHAKDGDDTTSIQEEINCLGMNALAFNVFRNKRPDLFKNQNAPIIEDGVELYTNLFFGNDENALVKRIKLKYGYLPISNSKHTLSDFAKKTFFTRNIK